VAIAGELMGSEEFTRGYWKGELYYDIGKKIVFPIMNSGTDGISQLLSSFPNVLRAMENGFDNNLDGEGAIKGGVWLISNGQILFEHKEIKTGDTLVPDVNPGKLAELRNLIEEIPLSQEA
jgi:hypothetical protein